MRARTTKIIDGKILFQCPKCLRYLSKTEFYQNKTQKNGITSYCRSCLQRYSNIKRIKNRNEVKDNIAAGLRCMDCTIIFNLPNKKKVVCRSCAARRKLKGLPKIKISKFKELGD